MASAMVNGLLSKGIYKPADIICSSAGDGTGQALAARTGIAFTEDTAALLSAAPALILAIKPQQLKTLEGDLPRLTQGRLILSILAGTPIATLATRFPTAANIVRAMPNTPGQIGAGITAYAPKTTLSTAHQTLVEQVLGSMGPVLTVPESDLDAVTATSGSGPAYVFEFAAALRDGAIAAGLTPETATQLALHTLLGSAKLLVESGQTPEYLRDQVTSPGGTTLAGLTIMQQQNFRQILKDTILAAQHRSRELAALA